MPQLQFRFEIRRQGRIGQIRKSPQLDESRSAAERREGLEAGASAISQPERIPRNLQAHQEDRQGQLCIRLPGRKNRKQVQVCCQSVLQRGSLQRVKRKVVPHQGNRNHAQPQPPQSHETRGSLLVRQLALYRLLAPRRRPTLRQNQSKINLTQQKY